MPDPALRRKLLVLFVVALAARLAAWWALGPGRACDGDENGYSGYAWSIGKSAEFVLSNVMVPGEFPDAARTAFRTPLLPLLMSPFASFGGVEAMRFANAVIGAACAPLLLVALRRTPLGARSLWPAAAYAVWPPAVYLSAQLLAEPLAVLLVLASIALAPGDAPAPRRDGLAGVLAGLAVLARPASLATAGLLALARGGTRRALWFALGLVVVVAPWIVRNAALHGRPLLTTNTGVTLVGANSAAALDAEWPGKWLPPEDVYAGRDDGPDLRPATWGWASLSEEESDRRFASDATAWVRAHPGDFARLCGFKLVRLFDPDQHSGKADAGLKRLVGWATYLPVLLLAAVGAVLALRDRHAWAPWAAVVAGTVLTTLVFYGDVRMRTPMDPALLAFAALAASRALDRLRGGAPGGR